jgi:hypothetical protein
MTVFEVAAASRIQTCGGSLVRSVLLRSDELSSRLDQEGTTSVIDMGV